MPEQVAATNVAKVSGTHMIAHYCRHPVIRERLPRYRQEQRAVITGGPASTRQVRRTSRRNRRRAARCRRRRLSPCPLGSPAPDPNLHPGASHLPNPRQPLPRSQRLEQLERREIRTISAAPPTALGHRTGRANSRRIQEGRHRCSSTNRQPRPGARRFSPHSPDGCRCCSTPRSAQQSLRPERSPPPTPQVHHRAASQSPPSPLAAQGSAPPPSDRWF